jgi:hypothetical protein
MLSSHGVGLSLCYPARFGVSVCLPFGGSFSPFPFFRVRHIWPCLAGGGVGFWECEKLPGGGGERKGACLFTLSLGRLGSILTHTHTNISVTPSSGLIFCLLRFRGQ